MFYGKLEIWLERVGIVTYDEALAECIRMYRVGIVRWAEDEYDGFDDPISVALEPLRGHNLACWCKLDAPCHADVLLELANPSQPFGALPEDR